jgi:hypothetical protein
MPTVRRPLPRPRSLGRRHRRDRGSKFKAVNAKTKSFTREKLKRRLDEIDAVIERYLVELDRADEVVSKTGMSVPDGRIARAIKKLAYCQREASALEAIEARMDKSGETQVSLTDPDARAMATTSRKPRVVGYNVQTAVETRHHLIVAHQVTNLGYDRDALAMMAHAAREVMSGDAIEAIADKGYYKGEEIVACEEAGIPVTVPKPHTSNAAAHGRFDRADFTYIAGDDAYVCPAVRDRHTASRTSRPEKRCTRTGQMFAEAAPSRAGAPPVSNAASVAGSTRTSLSAFSSASTMIPTECRYGVRPSSIRSVRSWRGWAPPTSR